LKTKSKTNPLSITGIAKDLGLSPSTVSRVLAGKAKSFHISEATSKKVLELARRRKFTPNAIARGLRLLKTSTIGVLIPDISNSFYAQLVRTVTEGLRRHGYSIILCDSQDDPALEAQLLELLTGRQVDGLIIAPVGQSSAHLAHFCGGAKPVVMVDRFFKNLKVPYVSSDNYSGARQAMEFFLENGHTRIACLKGLNGTASSDQRLRGYRQTLIDYGLKVDESLICGNAFDEQNGYTAMKQLLNRHRRNFTAVFAMNNLIASGALIALKEHAVKVPRDVSLIAFDEQPYFLHYNPPLTTIAQPLKELGKAIVELLLEQIKSPQARRPRGVLLPTSLVIRESVARIGPPIARKAARPTH